MAGSNVLNENERAVILTLLYSDVFRHPLTLHELHDNLAIQNGREDKLKEVLDSLVDQNLIKNGQGYYHIDLEQERILSRERDNRRARLYFHLARIFKSIIAAVPYVRAVILTGSISKGVIPPKGDVDYLIITKPGRLWLCRTLLILFKKVFLLNSRKFFCLNYFIDTDHLEITDRNMFTATEIAYAIPVYQRSYCREFLSANQWYRSYYPNKKEPELKKIQRTSYHLFKPLGEWLLSGKFGNKLDSWCYRKTHAHWSSKYKHMEHAMFELNFRSHTYVSKHHPHGFQFRVLEVYQDKIREYELKHHLNLQ